jgi:hypothetical protein
LITRFRKEEKKRKRRKTRKEKKKKRKGREEEKTFYDGGEFSKEAIKTKRILASYFRVRGGAMRIMTALNIS